MAIAIPLLIEPVLEMLYFNLPGAGSLNLIVTGLNIIVGCAYLYIVLTIATRLSPRVRQYATLTVILAATSMYAITQWSSRGDFVHNPVYDGSMMHPTLLVRDGVSNDAFLTAVPDVFAQVTNLVKSDR